MSEQAPPISFRDARLEPDIQARTPRGQSANLTAKRDLARYYRLLAVELRRVWLTEPEALLLCDTLNGVSSDADTLPLLWAVVDDAIRAGAATRHGVADPGALVLELRGLSPAQTFAVVDAVERFWAQPGEGSIADQLAAVGLIQEDQAGAEPVDRAG